MLESHLHTLGFTNNEIAVYLALADIGSATAGWISRATGIARTTTYSVIEALTKKGLVNLDHSRPVARYVALPPSALLDAIRKERQHLEERERAAKELARLSEQSFRNRGFRVPRLQIFEGRSAVLAFLRGYGPRWRKECREHERTWWGYQDVTFVEQYREWLDEFWQDQDENEATRIFSNDSPTEMRLRGAIARREIKTLPLDAAFSSTIWVAADYIIMLRTREEPHSALQIRDAHLADNLRTVFLLLWNAKF